MAMPRGNLKNFFCCVSSVRKDFGEMDMVGDSPKKESNLNSSSNFKAVTQAGTQTSPEETCGGSVKSHFNIGTVGTKEERISPKFLRKERVFGRSAKRAMSPAPQVIKIDVAFFFFCSTVMPT